MGYFRAIFVTQEISERAFDLTGETIEINPGNYSAWHFRRKLIHALQKDLQLELFWLNQVGLKMEKNY
jgi:protein farnesyltransferase/geranylgeranyltransferase type-1 subunit alpha